MYPVVFGPHSGFAQLVQLRSEVLFAKEKS